jgi:FtsZ-interacting cell division protein ZipA
MEKLIAVVGVIAIVAVLLILGLLDRRRERAWQEWLDKSSGAKLDEGTAENKSLCASQN